jgi:hypothetical protein
MSVAQSSAALVLMRTTLRVEFRLNAPAEFAWKIFGLTPKLESTLSR